MKEIVFYLGLGSLITHELDAVANHEWRVLPWLQDLPDQLGMELFVAAHIPLCAILIAFIASRSLRVRSRSRLVVSSTLVVHAVLHALSVNQVGYEFSSTWSNIFIFGGGAFGALHLLLELSNRFADAR